MSKSNCKIVFSAHTWENPYSAFEISGAGNISIAWGDGSVETLAIGDELQTLKHEYADAATPKTIVIEGDDIVQFYCGHMYKRGASIDTSQCPTLKTLFCSNTEFGSLDISGNANLEELHCGGCNLTSLDTSANAALKELHCDRNQLTALDTSANAALIKLSCRKNSLAALDLSANAALQTLYCCENSLASLDLSANNELRDLTCRSNPITALRVSVNSMFQFISCQGCQLDKAALNAFFETLPDGMFKFRTATSSSAGSATVNISENPGTKTCNRKLATAKNWEVSARKEAW
jgi:hypothetical protein